MRRFGVRTTLMYACMIIMDTFSLPPSLSPCAVPSRAGHSCQCQLALLHTMSAAAADGCAGRLEEVRPTAMDPGFPLTAKFRVVSCQRKQVLLSTFAHSATTTALHQQPRELVHLHFYPPRRCLLVRVRAAA